MIRNFELLEMLCQDGASFEDALAQIGCADSPLTITAQLFKYWKLLEMEHAYEAARVYYDRLLEERA